MKLGTIDIYLGRNFRQNSRQSPDLDWIVCRDRDVMGRSAKSLMSVGCSCRSDGLLRNHNDATVSPVRDRTDHEAVSSSNDLVLNNVKPNDGRSSLIVEVASDGIAHHGLQFIHGFCLGKDGVTQSAGFVASLRGVVHRKNNFTVSHACIIFRQASPLHPRTVRSLLRACFMTRCACPSIRHRHVQSNLF